MNQPYQPQPGVTYAPVQPAQANIDNGSLEFLTAERSDLEFQKANRHSGLVRFLKIALPVLAVVIIVLIAGALIARQFLLPNIDIGNIRMDDGKLVMENPNLNGVDQNQRPYSLRADRAIQDASNPSVVELQKISATLPMEQNISADILAGNGVYDADAKTLVLKENIRVETSDGMSIQMLGADVDIQNGTLVTSSPIVASSPQADISSNSMAVEDGGKRLVFEGGVKLTLRPKNLNKDDGVTNASQ